MLNDEFRVWIEKNREQFLLVVQDKTNRKKYTKYIAANVSSETRDNIKIRVKSLAETGNFHVREDISPFLDRVVSEEIGLNDPIIENKKSIQVSGLKTVTYIHDEINKVDAEYRNEISEMAKKGLVPIKALITTHENAKAKTVQLTYIIQPLWNEDNNLKYSSLKGSSVKPLRYLIISDLHIPFENSDLIYGLIDMAYEQKFTGIIINGDIIDVDFLSSYGRTLKNLSLENITEQITRSGQIFRYIESLKFQRMILTEGNHDERLMRGILGDGISGKGIKAFESKFDQYSLASLMRISENWEFYPYRERLKIADWSITHGEEHSQHIIANSIRENLVIGHTHRVLHNISNFVDKNNKRYSYNEVRTGCMIDLTKYDIPRVSHKQIFTWTNGFAVLHDYGDTGYVDNIIVDNNRFIFGNILYDFNGHYKKKIRGK